ncbi:MAG: DNA polymerase/3'-5' exonuclease PolX [Hamadaea sp.]|uniref:DNA polymerase/3'-5' exonuclease PolX n=1 Tax=Hamadaea sp. TaxID=2024425 RepID=UPI0017CAC763|nr:DNA polymerase/3'-5' exonuclease PolX [Hamadaea sp.]NUR69865.1 DNA polymerase/3'-5' exonuclease PolX [Hamadaea sp.]NUT22061.1 DNA polymerase/3'-5' exonuclease PolX [Hamadaea sp.]
MPRANDTVAALLEELADLLAVTGGADSFKIRAYDKAARAIAAYHEDISTLDAAGIGQIPNVGKSMTAKVVEYLDTGAIRTLEELRTRIPPGALKLMEIPGLGPKKAVTLTKELDVASVDELAAAIEAGRLDGLPGFGAKTADNILHGIELLRRNEGRVLIDTATAVAEEIVTALSRVPGCESISIAGSLRRFRDSIGDVDILAAAADSAPLMAAFKALPIASEVIGSGPTKTSIRTRRGLQVDLRVVPIEAWGAALQYFTGSKAHNIRVREIAVHAKLKLSEYGLFDAETGELLVSRTEEEVYERLGLPWIPPTLREDRGEIEAALRRELPPLITEADLRGDLHTHTDLTDGVSPLEKMVAAAIDRGLEYYAVTDHAPNLVMQRMTTEKMLAQRDLVRSLDTGSLTLLHGTELNIDPIGQVDWDGDFLAGFDITVASVHSHFTLPSQEQTQRLIRACENAYVNIIGHPRARMIGRRPPIDADWDAVFEAAAATGTALEVNSFPDRMDLSDDLILRAKRRGVKFAIDTDAHSTRHMRNIRFGIGTAQRGWLTVDDVINAWPLARLRAFVGAKRP